MAGWNRKPLTAAELNFIQQHKIYMTASQIGKLIGRDKRTVGMYMKGIKHVKRYNVINKAGEMIARRATIAEAARAMGVEQNGVYYHINATRAGRKGKFMVVEVIG